ncbi:MAG: LptF/LptG family permease [Hyphomonadaceae bacterium]
MIGFNRIQRYIFKECLASFLLILGIISVAILLVDTVEQLRTVGARTNISIGFALYLALLKFPMLAEQTMPFAVLAGSMMTFRRLSRRAELPVIRASGLSAWTFLLPPIVAALLIGIMTTTIVSPVGANLNAQFEETRNQLVDSNAASITVFENGIWLLDISETGQTIINAQSVDDTGTIFKKAKFIVENRILQPGSQTDRYVFARRYDVGVAHLTDGFWQLEDVIENAPASLPRRYDQISLATSLQTATLTDRFSAPSSIGFWDLSDHIERAKAAGLKTEQYEIRLAGLTALPLVFVVMSLIGTLACLRLARLGGTARLMGGAALGAVGFYFANQVSANLGASGSVPTVIAAWAPPLFCLFVCLTIIAFNEDG